jgi:integrase
MSEYQATRVNLGRQTQARDGATIRNHVLPRFGTWAIGSVQPIQVAQWVADLDAAGYAPATVRKTYQLFAAAMDAAVESGLIGRSPCRGVKLPRLETRATIRYLEPTEVNNLVSAIDSRYSAMVLAAAYTGLRFSELRALRVDRFDALRRTIRVSDSLVESGGQFYFDNPKSEASRRTVRVPAFLVDARPPTLRSTQMTPVSSSLRQAAGRSGGATSGVASGCRRWRHRSVNLVRSTTCGIRMPRC